MSAKQLHDRKAALVSAATARDPRSAPVFTHSNVSVPETCRFYGVADAISRCRVPRSCQDCLATPGCGITSYGDCRNTSEDNYFSYDKDYRNATFPAGSLMSNVSSYFLAGTATYCAATDPVCTKCRQEFREIDAEPTGSSFRYVGTQYCKGGGGCVCIGVCEVPKVFLQRTVDYQCDQPSVYSKNLPKVEREPLSVGRGDPRAPVVKVAHTSKKQETCAYTTEIDLRGCRRPRTCQECLLKPECILQDAECGDVKENYNYRDFRDASLDSSNMSYADRYSFPSSNTTYCSASDATCAKCRQSFRDGRGYEDYGWYSLISTSKFCVGQDGCVCIEACEAEIRSTGVYDEDCYRSNNYNRPETANAANAIVGVFVCLLLYSVFACWHKASNSTSANNQRRQREGRPRVLRHMLDQAPSVIQMNLSGWRGDHERLREREQRMLRGEDLESAPLEADNDEPDCRSLEASTDDESSRNDSSNDLQDSSSQTQRSEAVRRRSTRNL